MELYTPLDRIRKGGTKLESVGENCKENGTTFTGTECKR